jgi:hypothetical protein
MPSERKRIQRTKSNTLNEQPNWVQTAELFRRAHSKSRKLFSCVLQKEMRRHHDSIASLLAGVERSQNHPNYTAVRKWLLGLTVPRTRNSLEFLRRVERRYKLPPGHFKAVIAKADPKRKQVLLRQKYSDKEAFVWHLPVDFEKRSKREREEIETWIADNVLGGYTAFGRYQRQASKSIYAISFSSFGPGRSNGDDYSRERKRAGTSGSILVAAPRALEAEIQDLIEFKTGALPRMGYRRWRRWAPSTAYIML